VPAVELEIYDLYGMELMVAYREIEFRHCVLQLQETLLFIENIWFFLLKIDQEFSVFFLPKEFGQNKHVFLD
jgi:hypothetical protein